MTPKNILMIGPTGCGKTEISRRLAKLADAPFVKVEATKFTEIGYVGRDVEQIARDLVEEAVRLEKERRREAVKEAASQAATERLLDALTGKDASGATRESFKRMLGEGHLDSARGRDRPGRPALHPVRDSRHGRPGRDDQPLRSDGQGDGPAAAQEAQAGGQGSPGQIDRGGIGQAPRSRRRQPHRAQRTPRRTASSSSTRSTRSRSPTCAAARSAARASSATCCR